MLLEKEFEGNVLKGWDMTNKELRLMITDINGPAAHTRFLGPFTT